MPPPQGRDIIVIGASAGGVEALSALVSELPADLPASLFVVLHMGLGALSRLPEILTRRGPLRATHALHGEELEHRRIYVAPPDMHLILRPGYMHVVRSAKENGNRPSVDTLFRSAASVYGPRVIGVVLSGYMDCGTAGLMSIKARGGVALAQDPADANVPDMPASAIEHADVDHIAPLTGLSKLLVRLAHEPPNPWPENLPNALKEFEGEEPGVPVEIVCPSCQGSLTESNLGNFAIFRCHVGHAFSLDALAAEQAQALEQALWAAARALEESAALADRIARRSVPDMRRKFEEKVDSQLQHARLIQRILDGKLLRVPDRLDEIDSGARQPAAAADS
jgi:two-component system, chemotaxis family, protein-glutamate methylesterase/glutaminase